MSNILKTIWKNKKEILEGIKNSVIRDEFVEKIALLRNDTCNNCELKGDEAATYSSACGSTIGAKELNGRVRNGNGCDSAGMVADKADSRRFSSCRPRISVWSVI